MPYRTTRTVKTIITDGSGRQRVETKTYTDGDDDDSGSRGFSTGFKSRFGNMKISMGGGDDSGGGSGGYSSHYSSTQRPSVIGRSSRRERKNPFSGYEKQSYDDIVRKCQSEGILFEDPEFPAEDNSIFFSRQPPRPFEWKRPSVSYISQSYLDFAVSGIDPEFWTGGSNLLTVKFLNFRTPKNFAAIYLKFKRNGQTLGCFVKMMQME